MPARPIRPLNVGNIVSAGMGLYRSHLKPYLWLSLRAHLWSLVPIYGWAKFQMLSAAIARHAFHELINEPESIATSETEVRPHMWLFFALQLLVLLLLFGINIALSVLQFLAISLPISLLFGTLGDSSQGWLYLIQIVINVVFYIVYLWFWSHIFLPEMPLAIDKETDIVNNIGRSWQLTRGLATRVLLVISIAGIITIPLYILAILPAIVVVVLAFPVAGFAGQSAINTPVLVLMLMLAFLAAIALFLVVGTLVLPLWQAIKAIIYYDLQSRKEGLGLQLRDRA